MTQRRYGSCLDTRPRGEKNIKQGIRQGSCEKMLYRCQAKVDLILDEVESTVHEILQGLYTISP
jgi:hypothetical protein